jgi:predicted O-methyltransferase YrrM
MGYWPYNILFEKYKADCTVFFETGTHKGDSVQDAYDLGFERIISIEVNKDFYNHCMERFQPLDAWEQIKLFLGKTEDNIEKLIQEWVNGRAMFWIDAHGGGSKASSPYQLEIEAILKHERNDHVIIIDDVNRTYIEEKGQEWIKETLSKHNPLYKFEKTRVHPNCGDQLIAYI